MVIAVALNAHDGGPVVGQGRADLDHGAVTFVLPVGDGKIASASIAERGDELNNHIQTMPF
ncbi:hypothetical protein D3C73_1630450 [compost metagenome]